MESRTEINYRRILRLIRQLPKKDIRKLTYTLLSEIDSSKSEKSLENLLLQAPTWSESDYTDFQNARIHFNKSRIA